MFFDRPLLLLIIPGMLFVWWIFFREKIWYTVPNPLLGKYLRYPLVIWIQYGIRCILILLLWLLLAGFQLSHSKTIIESTGKHIVIVLDISKSMLAEDISPNRLTRAQEGLISFLKEDSGDRFSYVVFAGKPFLLSSGTSDISGLEQLVRTTTPDLIRQDVPGLSGTNIGDALLLASTVLTGNSGAIILITDGRANLGLDPYLAAKHLQLWGSYPVYTIGIGNLSGSILSYTDEMGKIQYFYNEKWEKLKADIDAPMLQEIARITGGQYFHAKQPQDFVTIFQSLIDGVKSTPIYTPHLSYQSMESILVVLVGLLLSIHAFIARYIREKYWF